MYCILMKQGVKTPKHLLFAESIDILPQVLFPRFFFFFSNTTDRFQY